jgi:hypothetical protein
LPASPEKKSAYHSSSGHRSLASNMKPKNDDDLRSFSVKATSGGSLYARACAFQRS